MDLDKQLTVGIVQLVYHWSDRGHDGGHRECEAVNPASSVVPVPDVMHPRVSDRASFLGAVELGTVIREQSVIALAAGIGKQKTVLLPLPPKILTVIHLMPAQQPTKRLDELKWNVLVEQKLHRTIKR